MPRSDDLYHLLPHYPETAERSTALASQATLLFVLLYFVPETLRQETALMREIVDNYFCDNWVISLYMGHIVWLPEAWEGYKAAKAAISNTTANSDVKRISAYHAGQYRALLPQLKELLTEGSISQESLLDQVTRVLAVIRQSNVSLRWLLLHTAGLSSSVSQHKRSRQLVELTR